MKNETKYYTPSIEEFHVGFEYEELSGDKWFKRYVEEADFSCSYHCEGNEFDSIKRMLSYEKIRVKHLDREDIESLGWIYNGSDDADLFFIFKKQDMKLMYFPPIYPEGIEHINNQLTIRSRDQIIYMGKVKNKSELKKLMEMLGITKIEES